MRRTIRPSLEMLEGRALLSGIPAPVSGLAGSLTAVASRTLSGTQVVETFTETNVSNHDINIAHGPSNAGFTVTQPGKTVWNPNSGAVADFLVLETLKPHQSLTISDTWDARSNVINPTDPGEEGAPVSGTFTISNGLDQGKATATVSIPATWTVPVKRTHILPPRPPAHLPTPTHLVAVPSAGSVGPKLNPSSA